MPERSTLLTRINRTSEGNCDGSDGIDLLYERGGETRESLAERAYKFMLWMAARPESTLAVACHSGLLLALFNAVLDTDDAATKSWFETGEMRTLNIAVVGHPVPHAPLPIVSRSSVGAGVGAPVTAADRAVFPSKFLCVGATAAAGFAMFRWRR